MKILLVEDDPMVCSFIEKGMIEAGHSLDIATEGEQGLHLARNGNYDVITLDRMLPKLDGLTIVKTLKGEGRVTPVLILSALGDVDNRVLGLKNGGDDYLVKPFAFAELLARLEVLARRNSPQINQKLTVGDLTIDLISRKVTRAAKDIDLQTREFKLLEYLVRNKGQLVTRMMLLEAVWDYHFDPQTNVIDVHISRLRSKIDKDFKTPLIRTIRGSGYIIEDE
jgi:two-component system, OmpR family, response regulator